LIQISGGPARKTAGEIICQPHSRERAFPTGRSSCRLHTPGPGVRP